MTKKFLITFCVLCGASYGYSQDSNVPDSVRAMIERSQADTQFEQTARVQMNVQFGEFLKSMAAEPGRRAQVEAVMLEVLRQRAELSLKVTRSQASTSELKIVSDYGYLRQRLAPLLTAAELTTIDAREADQAMSS